MSRRTRVEEVIAFLGTEHAEVVTVLRKEGLFESEELDPFEADELRVAVSLVEDLGVNAAGVEVALHLRRRLLVLQRRLADALGEPPEEG